jgi:hypothetical protein
MPLARPRGKADQNSRVLDGLDLAALGRLEMNEPLGGQALLPLPGSDQELAVEQDDEGVLVDLMLLQTLALGQGEQDDPIGFVIGTKHPGCMRLDGLRIQLPELHLGLIIRFLRVAAIRGA